MTDENTEMAGIVERPFSMTPPASIRGKSSLPARTKLWWTDQRESVAAAVHIIAIVLSLAWRKQIPRRRLLTWARSFFGAWFSRKLRRIAPDSGFCFRARAPRRAISDQEGSSMLILLEDGASLAAPHTPHDEIRRQGRGRYSHWGAHIYFSSSDNTDPRTNGRVYRLVQRL